MQQHGHQPHKGSGRTIDGETVPPRTNSFFIGRPSSCRSNDQGLVTSCYTATLSNRATAVLLRDEVSGDDRKPLVGKGKSRNPMKRTAQPRTSLPRRSLFPLFGRSIIVGARRRTGDGRPLDAIHSGKNISAVLPLKVPKVAREGLKLHRFARALLWRSPPSDG